MFLLIRLTERERGNKSEREGETIVNSYKLLHGTTIATREVKLLPRVFAEQSHFTLAPKLGRIVF